MEWTLFLVCVLEILSFLFLPLAGQSGHATNGCDMLGFVVDYGYRAGEVWLLISPLLSSVVVIVGDYLSAKSSGGARSFRRICSWVMNMFCVFGFVAHVKIAADAVNGAGFGFSDLFGMYGLRIGYYVTFVGMVLITILVNKKRKVY